MEVELGRCQCGCGRETRLAPYNCTAKNWTRGEEAQRAISRYGFGYEVGPGQHAEFLEELLALCLQDAYTFAGDAGDGYDYSEQLFAFEIAAARDGVFLPSSYWRKRSGSLEHELEQAVESFRVPDREEA